MTQRDPKKRPTIHEAIEEFSAIRKKTGLFVRRGRLLPLDEARHQRLAKDILAIILDAKFLVSRTVFGANPSRLFKAAFKYVLCNNRWCLSYTENWY